jgi:hypothetical protein
MVFVELPLFARYLRLTDDELRAVQRDIMDNPHCGDLIPGGRGLRKMRAAIGGRGKRGGGRIIYYLWTACDTCYMVFAYSKTERGDLTASQLKRLAEVVNEEWSDG